MGRALALITAVLLCLPLPAAAQDARATLQNAARALGVDQVKSLTFTASGVSFAAGQSATPGAAWPRFNIPTFSRSVNYETASLRDEQVRSRAEMPPRGGGMPAVGEVRQIQVVSGDLAWNVTGETAAPAPVALIERQLQLWITPHGVIKAAMANNATVQGRTVAFAVPGRYSIKATLDDRGMVERVEAVLSNPVVGDMPLEVSYADYRDFGGVKFPMRIRQAAGGFPAADLTVGDVKPNAPVEIAVPDSIRGATMPYAKVSSESVADGVWYVTGGSHHSVVVEMSDHSVVVEVAAERRAGGRGHRGGAPARARQAHPVRDQQPPPLRPRGWSPRLRGGGRHRDHPRDHPRLLRGRAGRSRGHDAGSSADRAPEGHGGRASATSACSPTGRAAWRSITWRAARTRTGC